MPRYFLLIEYHGGAFSGWQRQHDQPSVQAVIEDACAQLGERDVLVYGAGRTDAGVHARGMVAHVDMQREWPERKLPLALNAHIARSDVAILKTFRVGDDHHARFDAVARTYEFRFLDHAVRSPLRHGQVWYRNKILQTDVMHHAAQCLIGRHDLTTFRSTQCQAKSPIRTITKVDITRQADEVLMTVTAPSFLHNQIRSLAGSLDLVGQGKWSPENFADALKACDRSACGPVAPAEGLCLTEIQYAADIQRIIDQESSII